MITAYDAGSVKSRPTGVGVYVRELARALKPEMDDALRLIGARRDGPLAATAATLMRGRLHQAWVQLHANGDVARVEADLVHYTNAVAPLRSVRPFVLTIQDLSLIRFPRYHPKLRLAAVPVMVWAARRARCVIVPSGSTARELHDVLGIPTKRIVITELAPAPLQPADEDDPSVLERFGLEDATYIASIATIEPRKNIGRLVDAFEQFVGGGGAGKLVLIGSLGWKTGALIRRLEASTARDRIITTGYLTDSDRTTLLRHAQAFAYVSLYEGYGLPVVEAMACGTPVVTSNLSSMPEAAGGAAVLVDPYDPAAIAHGLQEALQSRRELRQAGLRRTAVLSWKRTAAETRKVYESAVTRWV